MKRWTGTLRFADIGMGAWVLETADGKKVSLYGQVPDALRDRRVTVSGKEAEAMGFGPTGSGLAVEVHDVVPADA
jgi:hypothetical protein